MSLRTELTCQTCGGSGVVTVTSEWATEREHLEGLAEQPAPCPDCVEGIPRTLIEEVAEVFKQADHQEPFASGYARAALLALRYREEPK